MGWGLSIIVQEAFYCVIRICPRLFQAAQILNERVRLSVTDDDDIQRIIGVSINPPADGIENPARIVAEGSTAQESQIYGLLACSVEVDQRRCECCLIGCLEYETSKGFP